MKKRIPLLGLYLIISFVLIITAVVVSLTAGINLGSDIAGGTQFEVTINSPAASDKQITTIEKILKDNGERAEKIFVEDKDVDTKIVVRIADKKIEKQNDIKEAIVSELVLNQDDVSSFSIFNGTVTKKAVLWTSIAIVCLLLVVFIAGWLRYKIVAGLSLTFAILHTLMLCVAMFVITRIPITMVSLIEILCITALVLFAFVLTLERIKENAELKHNSSLTTEELVSVSKKSTLTPLIFLAGLIAVVCLIFVCVPVSFVALSAGGLFICLLAGVYSYYFVGVEFHERLLDLKVQADKMKLSRNVSPAPSKAKKTTTKKEDKE